MFFHLVPMPDNPDGLLLTDDQPLNSALQTCSVGTGLGRGHRVAHL